MSRSEGSPSYLNATCSLAVLIIGEVMTGELDLCLPLFAGGLMDRLEGLSVATKPLLCQMSAFTRLLGGSESILKVARFFFAVYVQSLQDLIKIKVEGEENAAVQLPT